MKEHGDNIFEKALDNYEFPAIEKAMRMMLHRMEGDKQKLKFQKRISNPKPRVSTNSTNHNQKEGISSDICKGGIRNPQNHHSLCNYVSENIVSIIHKQREKSQSIFGDAIDSYEKIQSFTAKRSKRDQEREITFAVDDDFDTENTPDDETLLVQNENMSNGAVIEPCNINAALSSRVSACEINEIPCKNQASRDNLSLLSKDQNVIDQYLTDLELQQRRLFGTNDNIQTGKENKAIKDENICSISSHMCTSCKSSPTLDVIQIKDIYETLDTLTKELGTVQRLENGNHCTKENGCNTQKQGEVGEQQHLPKGIIKGNISLLESKIIIAEPNYHVEEPNYHIEEDILKLRSIPTDKEKKQINKLMEDVGNKSDSTTNHTVPLVRGLAERVKCILRERTRITESNNRPKISLGLFFLRYITRFNVKHALRSLWEDSFNVICTNSLILKELYFNAWCKSFCSYRKIFHKRWTSKIGEECKSRHRNEWSKRQNYIVQEEGKSGLATAYSCYRRKCLSFYSWLYYMNLKQ